MRERERERERDDGKRVREGVREGVREEGRGWKMGREQKGAEIGNTHFEQKSFFTRRQNNK